MTKLKKTTLILSILLMIALVIDLFLGKGLMMTFYAIISIFIVNVFHPFFKKIFKADLSFFITLADMLFAVFGTYIGNRFDLYHTFFAYDIMLHFISGILISLTLYEVFFPSSYRNSIPLVARVSGSFANTSSISSQALMSSATLLRTLSLSADTGRTPESRTA